MDEHGRWPMVNDRWLMAVVSQIRLKNDANPLTENSLRRSAPQSPDPLIGKRLAAEIQPFWDTTAITH
jgi:hypothetical protein